LPILPAAVDVSDFSQMYTYLTESRERFLAKFRELGWDQVTKDRGATWNSMVGILFHMLDVEESWLHFPLKPNPAVPDLPRTFDALEAYHRNVAENTRHLLASLIPEALQEEFVLYWSQGKLKSSLEHILFHAFVDQVAHIGEMVCLLWQMDVPPPFMGWLDLHETPVQ